MSFKPQRSYNVIFNVFQKKNYLTMRNAVYEIDEVSTSIWELCDGEHTVEEIAEALTGEYDISYEEVLKDCQEFLSDLQAKGLVE